MSFKTLMSVVGGVARSMGAAIDAAGVALQGRTARVEKLIPNTAYMRFEGTAPQLGANVFVAPNACVTGHVEIGAHSSVWYGAVLRGDVNKIKVGEHTNIQDKVIVHVAKHNPNNADIPTTIGNRVTIGHGAIIHACTVGDESLVGMGAILLDGSKVENNAIVAAGAVLAPGAVVPTGQVWAGVPAKFLRDVSEEEAAFIARAATNYADLAAEHEMENTKTYEEVIFHEKLREDRQERPQDYDDHYGIHRDPVTREIISNPYSYGKVPM